MPVILTIDNDDDRVDFDDDKEDDDKAKGRKRRRRNRKDYQWKYMVALQKRLIKELKTVGVNQVGALTSKWPSV